MQQLYITLLRIIRVNLIFLRIEQYTIYTNTIFQRTTAEEKRKSLLMSGSVFYKVLICRD
jgi:hypothetical protein